MQSKLPQMPRRLKELNRQEALCLLGSKAWGRVIFTHRALPAVRPVKHLIDGDNVIILSCGDAPLSSATAGEVVAYEADDLDRNAHLGWSVVVTGFADLVRDPVAVARYRKSLEPGARKPTDQLIRIRPGLVTGHELRDD